jgi:uncharacterized lipoprotein
MISASKTIIGFVVSIGTAIAAGCSSEPVCDYSEAPYRAATSVPSLRAPEGLTSPDQSAALVVPPTPPNAKPMPEGKGKCLDWPPSYFSTTPRPAEAAPEKK